MLEGEKTLVEKVIFILLWALSVVWGKRRASTSSDLVLVLPQLFREARQEFVFLSAVVLSLIAVAALRSPPHVVETRTHRLVQHRLHRRQRALGLTRMLGCVKGGYFIAFYLFI